MAELSERLKKLTDRCARCTSRTKETQVAYERQHGPVQGPGELLQLLIRHTRPSSETVRPSAFDRRS
jgi:hypothetical protein